MTTASKRIIRETAHVRTAEQFLGGRLEDELKPYLNDVGTMSDLASTIGVQKATVNYWIMRLGIKYERVAYDEDETVRVYSREDAEVADAAIETGLDADDLEQLDRQTFDEFKEFHRNGFAGASTRNLSARDFKVLDAIKEVGDSLLDLIEHRNFADYLRAAAAAADRGIRPDDVQRLTRDDLKTKEHLREIGAKKDDVTALNDESIGVLRELEGKGLGLQNFAGIGRPELRVVRAIEDSGIGLDRVTNLSAEDLDLLDAVRTKGWDNPSKMNEDTALLSALRDAGLDDPEALDKLLQALPKR